MWEETFISTCWPQSEIFLKRPRVLELHVPPHWSAASTWLHSWFPWMACFCRIRCSSLPRRGMNAPLMIAVESAVAQWHTAPPWQQTHSRYGPGGTDKRPRYQHSSQSGARQEKTTIQHPTERSVMRQITRWGRRTNHRALACKKMCLLFIIFRFSTRW